jgi:hypothetical protein
MITVLNLPLVVPNIALSTKLFRLTDDYTASWLIDAKKYTIKIPRGFMWDGASIPQFLWSIIGFYPGGIMLPPSVVHDWIYICKGWLVNEEDGTIFYMSRKECDLLFRAHMIHVGMPDRKLNLAYKGVKWFGWTYWSGLKEKLKRKK